MLYYRKKDGKTYQATTWQIKFKLDNVDQSGTYKLRVAIAEATLSELQVNNMTCIYIAEAFAISKPFHNANIMLYKSFLLADPDQ